MIKLEDRTDIDKNDKQNSKLHYHVGACLLGKDIVTLCGIRKKCENRLVETSNPLVCDECRDKWLQLDPSSMYK